MPSCTLISIILSCNSLKSAVSYLHLYLVPLSLTSETKFRSQPNFITLRIEFTIICYRYVKSVSTKISRIVSSFKCSLWWIKSNLNILQKLQRNPFLYKHYEITNPTNTYPKKLNVWVLSKQNQDRINRLCWVTKHVYSKMSDSAGANRNQTNYFLLYFFYIKHLKR